MSVTSISTVPSGGTSRDWFTWGKRKKEYHTGVDVFEDLSGKLLSPSVDFEHVLLISEKNRYGVKHLPPEFHGCIVWVDPDASDREVLHAFRRQSSAMCRFVSGKNPVIKVAKGAGTKVSLDGKKMYVDTGGMFDFRIDKENRINDFFSGAVHESFHIKYTTPELGALLVAKGHYKRRIKRSGLIDKIPDWRKADEVFEGDPIIQKMFNITEDYRIERLGLNEYPGYVGYFDIGLAYATWLQWDLATEKQDEFKNFLYNYIRNKALLPDLVDRFVANNHDHMTGPNARKIEVANKLLDTIHDQDTMHEALELAKSLADLFDREDPDDSKDGKSGGKPQPGKMDSEEMEEIMGEAETNAERNARCEDGDEGKDSSKPSEKCKYDYDQPGSVPDLDPTIIHTPEEGEFDPRIYEESLDLSRDMKKDLDLLDTKFKAGGTSYGKDTGDVDEDELYSIGFNKNIFTEDKPKPTWELDIYILLDESGSMGVSKMRKAKVAALATFLAFHHHPNINLFLYGHTANLADDSVHMYRYYDPLEREFNINRIFSSRARSQNLDGYAILEAGKTLEKSTARSKILISVSDGQPAGHGYSGRKSIEHTRSAVTELEKKGMYVIQIAIDNIIESKNMFTHFVPYNGSERFGTDLMKIISGQFARIANTL
jgi:hypothetical protein